MLLSSIHHVISQHQQQISSLAEHQTATLRTLPTAQSCVTKGPEPLNQLIDSDPLEPTSCNSLWIPSLSHQAQKTGRGASLSVILTNTQISKLQTTSKHQLWNETPTCFTLGWILGYSLWYLPYPKHRNASLNEWETSMPLTMRFLLLDRFVFMAIGPNIAEQQIVNGHLGSARGEW